MKAAEAAYAKDLMNNVEVGGHPYSTYNTGKDVQKAVQALDPNRSVTTTSTASYNTVAPASTSTENNSQDYTNYYNQYYSDPNYYYYYQQYYAQYGYYPQQQEPKTAAELKEEEKNKQREYIEQQMRKYRPESEAPKPEPAQHASQEQLEQYAAAMAQYEAQQAQLQQQQQAPPQKKADEGAPGEWQEVSADDMYSSYYRPASPEGYDDEDDEKNNKKRPRSDSESRDSDEDEDNRGRAFARFKREEDEPDTGAEIVWKKRNTDNDAGRPKKKIRRTII